MHSAPAGDCERPDRVHMFGDSCFVLSLAVAAALFEFFARREAPKTTHEGSANKWIVVRITDSLGKG